jgi:hypothetical protein
MTNTELESKLDLLVQTERTTTREILALIRQAEERRIPHLRGYKSTHEWLIKQYRYSGSAAHRRVQAARLLKAVPEAEKKLVKGEVNLTTLTKVQSAITREEKRSGEKMDGAAKAEVLGQVEGKTEDATEKVLFTLFPEEAKKESLRQVNGEEARLSVLLGADAIEALKMARDLLSHALPNATWAEVIAYLAQEFTQRKTAPAAGRVAKKACEYVDSETGRRCESTYQLEVDHIVPRALGGSNHPSNLRCLCKQHNLLEAERKLGREFMRKYRRSG